MEVGRSIGMDGQRPVAGRKARVGEVDYNRGPRIGKAARGQGQAEGAHENAGQDPPHRPTPCSSRVCAVWMWQMAMARASAMSEGCGGESRSSSRATMNCTCSFWARPYPTTLDLIRNGAY